MQNLSKSTRVSPTRHTNNNGSAQPGTGPNSSHKFQASNPNQGAPQSKFGPGFEGVKQAQLNSMDQKIRIQGGGMQVD